MEEVRIFREIAPSSFLEKSIESYLSAIGGYISRNVKYLC